VWQLVQKAVPRGRTCGSQRAWAAQARRPALRRSRCQRTSADGAVRLDQPAAGRALYEKGEPRQARSPGGRVAAGTKRQQKCPTFSRYRIRWDNRTEKAVIIKGAAW